MKKLIGIRGIIQIFFFALVAILTVSHSLAEKGMVIPVLANASVHAICPFGGVVSIYQYFVSGTYVQKIHESSFVLMWIAFILAIGFGPVFCGWVCPLGSIQEWFSKIGRKIFKNKFNHYIPYKYDRYLRYIRYFVLAWVIYMTAMTGKLTFNEVDPYSALFHLWSDELAVGGLVVLIITLTASIFIERPWCKYACPYGALLGISNLFRVFKIQRNSDACINCNRCSKACPMNIKVADKNIVLDHQCISCLACTSEEACPVENTVLHKAPAGGLKLHIKISVLAVLLVATIFGGIGVSSALNMWNTTSSRVPAKIQAGSFEGQYDPSDIRGSYSLKDVENAFHVPVDVLGEAFGLTNSQGLDNIQLKSLESVYKDFNNNGTEIGTASVRLFVGLYTGLPIDLDGSYLPKSAVDILLEKGGLTDEQQTYIKTHSIDTSNIGRNDNIEAEAVLNTEASIEHSEEANTVSGKTTFAELIDWGISKEKIEEIIGSRIPAPGMTVSDYCKNNGIQFSTIKDTLNKWIQQ